MLVMILTEMRSTIEYYDLLYGGNLSEVHCRIFGWRGFWVRELGERIWVRNLYERFWGGLKYEGKSPLSKYYHATALLPVNSSTLTPPIS